MRLVSSAIRQFVGDITSDCQVELDYSIHLLRSQGQSLEVVSSQCGQIITVCQLIYIQL